MIPLPHVINGAKIPYFCIVYNQYSNTQQVILVWGNKVVFVQLRFIGFFSLCHRQQYI